MAEKAKFLKSKDFKPGMLTKKIYRDGTRILCYDYNSLLTERRHVSGGYRSYKHIVYIKDDSPIMFLGYKKVSQWSSGGGGPNVLILYGDQKLITWCTFLKKPEQNNE